MSDVDAKKRLRNYLNENGFCAYPREMHISIIDYYYCDVVGYKDGYFYAFEIKQKGDNIPKALKQLKAYSVGVHYCVVVVDEIGYKHLHKFKSAGYGVWRTNGKGYDKIADPKPVDSDFSEIDDTEKKFSKYCSKYRDLKRGFIRAEERMKDQKFLTDFA